MISEAHNIDCMEFMRALPDKFFDLGLLDPPYGLNDMKKNKNGRHRGTNTSYKNSRIPDADYFQQMYRVCTNTIIFGCQYMIQHMKPGGSFVVWDKVYTDPDLHNMSSCDIAWYSKLARVRTFRYAWCGAVKQGNEQTIHPHEKPVPLYQWLLKNYAKPGDKIFDSHMGSQSSRIAAHDMGFDYWGCELDKKYFADGNKRFEQHKAQLTLFKPTPAWPGFGLV